MSRQLLIAGLDPGTTFAYALLDLDGRPVVVDSVKEHSQQSIVKDITHHGRILVLGSDKKGTPDTVSKIAAQTGARIIEPDHDLSVQEKRDLTRSDKPGNSHERDALAAAYTHYRSIAQTIVKIRKFIEREGLDDMANEITLLVIRHDINVRHARELLDKERSPDTSDERELALNAVKKPQRRERTILKLYDKVKALSLRTSYLERELEKEREKQKGIKERQETDLPQSVASYEEKLGHKDTKIRRLQKERRKDAKRRKRMQGELTTLSDMLDDAAQGMLVVRALPDLSNRNVDGISDGEVVYVKDTSIMGNTAIKRLRDSRIVLLYDGRLARPLQKEAGIRAINRKDLAVRKESKTHLVIEPDSLEKASYQKDIIERIVDEHRGSHA